MPSTSAIALAADLCREFEGFYAKPYICPAGYPTIGYGTCFYPDGRRVAMSDPAISKEYANELLHADLLKFYAGVVSLCPSLLGEDRRAGAILDFTYNLGVGRLRASTLRKRVLERDWEAARLELGKWVYGGGRVLPGLVRRRAAEAILL